MAMAQAFHPGLISDSTMFIDDDWRSMSSGKMIDVEIAKTAAKIGGGLGRVVVIGTQCVAKDVRQVDDLVMYIEPAAPGSQRDYPEHLKSHIVDIDGGSTYFIVKSQPYECTRTSYRESTALEFYISSLRSVVTNSVDCDVDLYYRPLIERIRSFQYAETEQESVTPVSEQTINEVLGFVRSVLPDVRRPAAALGSDGSIALVWQGDKHYITAVFYGTGSYSYVVRQQRQTVAAASSRTDFIPTELCNPIRQFFKRV